MRSLTILQAVTLSERGGAQRHVADLSAGLVRRGHRVHLACGGAGPLIDEARATGITVHPLRSLVRPIDPLRDAAAFARLVSLIRALRPDVVHGHSSKAGLLARAAARTYGVPSVFTAHGFVFLEPLGRSTRATYLAMERLGGALGTRLIAVSDRDAEAAAGRRIARRDEITVIPNGYDPPRLPAPPPASPPFRFAAIANPYPTKGLDVLVAALGRPALAGVPVDVVVAGDGPDRAVLERRASGLPLRFLGRVTDVASVLDSAHASVLPSRKEGWPYAVLESMGAARPVVATNVGGIPEQLDGNACGWIVEPGDADALAAAIAEAAADPIEAARRGRAGYERVRSTFTLDRMIDAVEDEYGRALAARRRAGRSS